MRNQSSLGEVPGHQEENEQELEVWRRNHVSRLKRSPSASVTEQTKPVRSLKEPRPIREDQRNLLSQTHRLQQVDRCPQGTRVLDHDLGA